jgi:hypothetical protein
MMRHKMKFKWAYVRTTKGEEGTHLLKMGSFTPLEIIRFVTNFFFVWHDKDHGRLPYKVIGFHIEIDES